MTTTGSLILAIRRHPGASARDAVMIGFVMMIAVLLALEYELTALWDEMTEGERRISVEEIFALTLLLAAGICLFVVRRVHDIREDLARELALEAETGAIRKLAMQDPLTGLPNRRVLEAALGKALETPREPGKRHAFYVLDLNGFKRVNDGYGHAAGDAVLRAIAERFRRAARKGDLVARLGGDEFAVLAADIDSRETALEIGERFMAALVDEIRHDDRSYAVGVAVGVALYPDDGETAREVMHHADLAMYKAKADAKRSALEFYAAA